MRYLDIAQQMLRECPEAPLAMLESEAKRATLNFCRQSRFLVDEIELDLDPGEAKYRLRGRGQTRVDQIHSAVLKTDTGELLSMSRVGEFDLFDVPDSGLPRYFALVNAGQEVQFSPVIDRPDHKALLKVVLVPLRRSDQMPAQIGERWQDGIISGALCRIMKMPNKPWTDMQLSAYHDREYHIAVNHARQASLDAASVSARPRFRRWV